MLGQVDSVSASVSDFDRYTVSKLYLHLIQNYLKQTNPEGTDQNLLDDLVTGLYDNEFRYGQQVPLYDMERILERMESRFGGLGFGLDIGRHVHPSDFGVVGYALMNCESLLHALKLGGKLKHIMNEGFDVFVSCQAEYCRYQVKNRIQSKLIPALVEMDFSAAVQLARFLVGSQNCKLVKFIQVNFQHQPIGDISRYEEIFDCPVKFGQESSEIILSGKVLKLPVRSADPRLLQSYIRKVERMQMVRKTRLSTHQKVFTYVADHMGKELPGIESAASNFNMSISTLKNHLRQEGHTYSQIIDLVRKNKAVKLVGSPSLQLKEIASELGFSNPAAFTRAFKRWTSMSPVEYRKTSVASC